MFPRQATTWLADHRSESDLTALFDAESVSYCLDIMSRAPPRILDVTQRRNSPNVRRTFREANSSCRPKFFLFEELPPEIRIKIWKLALPDQRLLVITVGFPFERRQKRLTQYHRIPALLQVCSESRTEALMVLRKVELAKAYMNPNIDFFYFSAQPYRENNSWVPDWSAAALDSIDQVLDLKTHGDGMLDHIKFLGLDWRLYALILSLAVTPGPDFKTGAAFFRQFQNLEGLLLGCSLDLYAAAYVSQELQLTEAGECAPGLAVDSIGRDFREIQRQSPAFKLPYLANHKLRNTDERIDEGGEREQEQVDPHVPHTCDNQAEGTTSGQETRDETQQDVRSV